MSNPKKEELLIGAHTSAAGGVFNALYQGEKIGATTVQLFTSNQKQWKSKILSQKEIDLFEKAKEETGITTVMCHDSYLINLGSPNPELLEKSRKAFAAEIERCIALKINYLNFHPGAYTTSSMPECLDKIVESLLEMAPLLKGGPTRLLIETTAGQGTTSGAKFSEIGYLVKKTKGKIPIGVCIDTCHIFAAGYDIRTKAGWDKTLKEFDDEIGLEHLYAFHLNDSLHPLGSRKDRHALLGEGEIGIECFKILMTHPKTRDLPKYLETPDPEKWPEEIKRLRSFAKLGKIHATS